MTDGLTLPSGVNPSESGGWLLASSDRFTYQLDQDVTRALVRVDDFYRRTVSILDRELQGLEALITSRLNAGQDVPVSWLHRQARYRDLLAQAQNYGRAYGDRLAGETLDTVQRAFRQGEADALRLLDEAIPGYSQRIAPFNRLPERAVNQYLGAVYGQDMAAGPNPLGQLFDSYGPDARKTVEQAIGRGLSEGLHPNQVTDMIRRDLHGSMVPRAATVVRTETYRAYREANRQSYRENADVVPTWVWNAHIGEYTCAACFAMHGQEFPVDTPMGTHPNCRCTMVPKTLSWAELGFEGLDAYDVDMGPKGDDAFATLPDAQQRKILGPGKYRLYKDGEANLSDMVAIRKTDRWGTTRSVASLDQTRANATRRKAAEARRRAALTDTRPKWEREIEDRAARGVRSVQDARELGNLVRTNVLKDTLPDNLDSLAKEYHTTAAKLKKAKTKVTREVNKAYGKTSDPAVIAARAEETRLTQRLDEIEDSFRYKPLPPDVQARRTTLRRRQVALESEYAQINDDLTYISPSDRDFREKREALRLRRSQVGRELSQTREAVREIDLDREVIDLSKPVTDRLRTVRSLGSSRRHTLPTDARGLAANDPALQAEFEAAIQNYPTDWIDDSIDHGPMIFTREPRGYYQASGNYSRIVTSGPTVEDRAETWVHEMGHRLEDAHPTIRHMERDFYEDRVGNDRLVSMNTATGQTNYKSYEKTRPDEFFNPYLGKDYGGSYYEIASMGFQAVLHPGAAGNYKAAILSDPDTLDFILGLLFGG